MGLEIWIDRGGTFTDCIGHDTETGEVRVAKVLSSDRAPIDGIRALLSLGADDPIPPCDIRMGTTVATNALLERKGAPCALVTTRGFRDILAIGDQTRPDLFALRIEKPELLYREVVEIDARVDAHGRELSPIDEASVRAALEPLRGRGIRSLAVVLLHAYAAPDHERAIGRVAHELGFEHVSLSHEVAAEIGIVGRGDTTVADAYLTPLLRDYVRGLLDGLPGSRLRIMQSSGGLTDAHRFRGKDAILSGPAGGVVAVAHVARLAGVDRAIGFDMGGTSTDVSRVDAGTLDRVYETSVAGVRIRAPMLAIHTVAAGGGSICRYDGRRFTVGPDSAGAIPGPLCYGHPGARELTLSDVSVALGRLLPDRFPFPLAAPRAVQALDAIAARLHGAGDPRSAPEIAEGFVQIAVENMAEAIRRVSVARGVDPRGYGMVVFGGAGGQFACRVARRLGIRTLVLHPFAGVLSALGMGVAPITWHGEADAGRREIGGDLPARVAPLFDALEERGRRALALEGIPPERTRATRLIDLRYVGTETALTLPITEDAGELARAFHALHRAELGYSRDGHPIEAVTARVDVIGESDEPAIAIARAPSPHDGRTVRAWIDGAYHDVPVRDRETLGPGERVRGPLLVLEQTATIVVEPGFELEHRPDGIVVLHDRMGEHDALAAAAGARKDAPDPVLLEVFHNLFASIAEQMGTVLRRTALSTNIRERLDYSCAVFDGSGNLVANAPHIPVHLGAMGESVRAVIRAHPDPSRGDVFVTNDPSAGGSHLPDITVVTPVHDDAERVSFFVASRGHHADVGGITPGSMPPFSSRLDEEGVVFCCERVVRGGRFDEARVRAILCGARFPARRPADNVADLEAQIAANRKGERLLEELCRRYGRDVVDAYMRHVQDDADALVREAIAALPDGTHAFEDALDDGTPIRVALDVKGDRMRVDFTGTGRAVDGNLNAPRAVTIAAVLYVLRTLVGRKIPLNAGCLRSVEVEIPEGSLLSPEPWRAVAGGNVETSQRVVDVLLGALGHVAASQGTMNNVTFGDAELAYYETIGGGAGAGDGFHGASGVHTHMTNSRITDPEVLEARFPVRLVRFEMRHGSGGSGRFRGGDGLVREIQMLAPLRVSILSERRVRAPWGARGGAAGARGRNLLDGRDLGGKATVDAPRGARLIVETPGGGGYGADIP